MQGPHDIVTLDPNKFTEKKQQCLHIGNLQSFTPRISLLKQSSPVFLSESMCLAYDEAHITRTGMPLFRRLAYPPHTKAFLYYFMSPDKPRIAGELRLRVTSSDDAASFESGSDLLRQDGRPWRHPLYSVSKLCPLLYEKLKEDQFIPDDLNTALATLPSKKYTSHYRNHFFYSLNDTFIVDFNTTRLTFFVVTEQGVEQLVLYKLFSDSRLQHKLCRPYTGAYTSHRLPILLY